MDVSVSAGGRVARTYMQVERQRKITSMMNGLEAKRYHVIRRQINDDKTAEINVWNRRSKEILKYSDDMKAFQKALLKRISDVKEINKRSTGIRPLLNLGRYGGAPIDQIKANLDKYRPVRNPTERRLLKTKQLLQQGKATGLIKTFKRNALGDMTEEIMKLEKVDKAKEPISTVAVHADSPQEASDGVEDDKPVQNEVIMRRRRLVLPPLQVSRTMRPNENYHRKIVEESETTVDERKGKRRRSVLPGIPEERSPDDRGKLHDIDDTLSKGGSVSKSTKGFYQWSFLRPHQPDYPKNYLTNNQRYWKQDDSIIAKHASIILPRIR